VSEEDAEKMAEKMAKGTLSLDDFLKQMRSLRRMGPMKQLLGLLPGVGSALKDVQIDDKQLDRVEGIVHAMTPEERRRTDLINNSRRRRIAQGAGVAQDEVSKLTKQFDAVSKISKQMAGMGLFGQMKAMKEMQAGGQPGAGGAGPSEADLARMMGMGGRKSTHMSSPKAKFKQRKR
jgi:signal recognition particle subunit SRP54